MVKLQVSVVHLTGFHLYCHFSTSGLFRQLWMRFVVISSLSFLLLQSVLVFNLASFLSREAIRAKKQYNSGNSTPEDNGIKRAFQLFLQSSGVFEYLRAYHSSSPRAHEIIVQREKNSSFTPSFVQVTSNSKDLPSTALSAAQGHGVVDVDEHMCAFFRDLMIAQAQASFYENASANKVSNSLLVKIAFGVASLYLDASLHFIHAPGRNSVLVHANNFLDKNSISIAHQCNPSLLSSILGAHPKSYRYYQHCRFQHLVHCSIAFRLLSEDKKAESNWAHELFYLQLCKKCHQLIEHYYPVQSLGLVGSLEKNYLASKNLVESRYREAHHDNEHIYFAIVPDKEEEVAGFIKGVSPTEKLINAKITPFSLFGASGTEKVDEKWAIVEDPFSSLISSEVIHSYF